MLLKLFLYFMDIMYNSTRLFISSMERQHTIISNIHKGLGCNAKAKAGKCQKQGKIKKISSKIHSITLKLG